jgi:hypothetical protein
LFSRVGGQSNVLHLEEVRITGLLNSFRARTTFYLDVGKYEPRYLPIHRRIVARLNSSGAVFSATGGRLQLDELARAFTDLLISCGVGKRQAKRALRANNVSCRSDRRGTWLIPHHPTGTLAW